MQHKYLHILPTFTPGGAESQLKSIILHSQHPDHHHVISLLSSSRPLLSERISHTNLPLNRGLFCALHSLLRLALILRKPYRSVSCWMYHSHFLSVLLYPFIGSSKLIWLVRHGTITKRTKPFTRLIFYIDSLFSHSIPSLIAYNSYAGFASHTHSGYSSSKSIVIPNGCDCTNFFFDESLRSKCRKSLSLSDDTFLIGSIARFSPQKDQISLIQQYSTVYKHIPNSCLVLYGHDIEPANPYLANVLSHCPHLPILLLGPTSTPNLILNGLDLYISSSLYGEGFPNILLEASYTGLPSISTNVGDALLLTPLGVTLYQPYNSERLASLLIDEYRRFNADFVNTNRHRLARSKSNSNSYSIKKSAQSYLDAVEI